MTRRDRSNSATATTTRVEAGTAGQKFCADGKTIDPEEIVRMATINGAKILGLDSQIGSLETGKQADMIVVDLQKAGYDIYSTLVYNTSGGDVVDSIINGQLVMEDGKLLTIDEDEVLKKVQSIADALKVLPANKGASQ